MFGSFQHSRENNNESIYFYFFHSYVHGSLDDNVSDDWLERNPLLICFFVFWEGYPVVKTLHETWPLQTKEKNFFSSKSILFLLSTAKHL